MVDEGRGGGCDDDEEEESQGRGQSDDEGGQGALLQRKSPVSEPVHVLMMIWFLGAWLGLSVRIENSKGGLERQGSSSVGMQASYHTM